MKTKDFTQVLYRIVFATLFILVTAELYSQETGTCAEKLKSAQSFFEKGQVEEVPGLLKDCLKSGFKKEEELTAYKLIIQTFLLNDKIVQADSMMFEFLKKNPEYVLSPTDHSSFVYLFNKFRVKPVVQIGIHGGINIPFLTTVSENLTGGYPGKSTFKRNIGLNIFVESKFKISEKLEVGLEAGFSQLKFSNKINDYNGYAVIDYTESFQRIEVPVNASYSFSSFGKFTPYIRAGFGAGYNLAVTSTATTIDYKLNRTGESLTRKDSRILIDCFGQIGAGIKFKIPKGFLFAETRSSFGILQQNVPGGKTVDNLEWYYFWGDPDFRLNAVRINIGYTYILYKPTKRKE